MINVLKDHHIGRLLLRPSLAGIFLLVVNRQRLGNRSRVLRKSEFSLVKKFANEEYLYSLIFLIKTMFLDKSAIFKKQIR